MYEVVLFLQRQFSMHYVKLGRSTYFKLLDHELYYYCIISYHGKLF